MPATGYAASGLATATDRAITLNERLNTMSQTLQYQCERLESVLSRVNGTPSKLENVAKGGSVPTPTLPMSATVEHIEQAMQRLADLATGIERIA